MTPGLRTASLPAATAAGTHSGVAALAAEGSRVLAADCLAARMRLEEGPTGIATSCSVNQ